jgi:hypothetical protein
MPLISINAPSVGSSEDVQFLFWGFFEIDKRFESSWPFFLNLEKSVYGKHAGIF